MAPRTYPLNILEALVAYAHHVYEMAYLGQWPQNPLQNDPL